MDTGCECFVEFANPVGCQDNYSGEVFEDSEEHYRSLARVLNQFLSCAKTDQRREHSLRYRPFPF